MTGSRLYRNLIAVLIVVLVLALMLVLAGCSSIKMERVEGDYRETIVVRAPPKDFTNLNFKWHDTHLKAGEAATSEQPWADVVGEYSSLLLNVNSYCRAYPAMCQNQVSGRLAPRSAGSTHTNCSVTMDQTGELTLWENGVPMSKITNWCKSE